MNRILGFSTLGFILLVAFYSNANYFIFGHTFSGDESASFLTLVEMMKIHSQLALKDVASNVTLAKEHADETAKQLTANDTKEINERNPRLATELNNTLSDFVKAFESEKPSESAVKDKASSLGDILSEVVSARIDKQQLGNVTVKAAVVNDLVGKTLENYNSSLGMREASHDKNNTSSSNSTEAPKIVDKAAFEDAQGAVSRAIALYNEIKPSGNANSTELANALNSLKDKIDSKSPFDEADKIVDDKITPILNDMFKLKLAVEEDHG
ncbi:MAG TPA: hypothetical protein VH481_10625 [Nitrososphaeraceae archaeon]|jgi:hypothetical protein